MKKYVDRKPMVTRKAKAALKKNGITPVMGAIRGGTDGATFSFKGVPTPNIGTGSYNHHGRYEFAVLEEMEKMVEIALEIFKL